ncbi:MAG TPA: hypothetical protein IAD45_06640 [Candidatus Faecimonas intestinavium]|nr:hypothetical protein [Candidatus Faecimonas intestinavium]
MNLRNLIKKLEIYTNIPRLQFEFETKEYIYMADTMDRINYIFKNISLIEGNKENLKIYKDDKETIRKIRESISFYEKEIQNSLKVLDENYKEHCKQLHILNQDEEEDEL